MSNQTNPKEVFISHSHKQDADSAHRLARDLEAHGHRPWIAPDSIPPGDNWVAGINRGLTQSDALVVVMTPAAIESQWVNLETNVGLQRAVAEGKLFIPLEFAPCAAPVLWSAFQFISFRESYDRGLQNLLGRLGPQPPSAPLASPRTRLGTEHPLARGGSPRARLGTESPPELGDSPRMRLDMESPLVQVVASGEWAQRLLTAAAQSPITAINPDAALFKFAQDTRLGVPESDEFQFSTQGNTYVGQLFDQGIAYAKLGDWGNVKALSKPEGL